MMQNNIANAIAQAGALSRYISNINNEISDMERQQYEEQCKAEDRVSHEWHEYILGVGTYAGPEGPVELPTNRPEPWYVDPEGGYHQPPSNEVPDPSWKRLEPVEPGDPGWNHGG